MKYRTIECTINVTEEITIGLDDQEILTMITRGEIHRSAYAAFIQDGFVISRSGLIEAGRVKIWVTNMTMQIDNLDPITINSSELRLMLVLMAESGQIVPRRKIIQKMWMMTTPKKRNRLNGVLLNFRKKLPDGFMQAINNRGLKINI